MSAGPTPAPEGAAPTPERQDPLQLLREVIASLNSPGGTLPDQAQVANLLTEAQNALVRANAVAVTLAQCQELLKAEQFEKAVEAVDACLQTYPGEPALLTRRAELEEQRKKFIVAAAVRKAIEEAQFLLDQDRPDLAANLLKGKAAELPEQPALRARLKAVEATLPEWEKIRCVRTALEQAAALEQLQQWQAALTILEEALQPYPTSDVLVTAAQRVRGRLAGREREKRLALRLKLIAQKIATQSWQPALALLKETHKEFPEAAELKQLQGQVDAGLRRSECEAVITEVRQCIEDGELELAEQALKRGVESLGPEPSLEPLRQELEDEARYREELRRAQALFGRRQLREAEAILLSLGPNRPEAKALLNAVRQTNTAAEEGDFYERGREKVLALMEQRQYGQALDLLNNLRTLFPGNPILERDFVGVQFAASLQAAGGVTFVPKDGRAPEPTPKPEPTITPAPPVEAQVPVAPARTVDREPVRPSHNSRVRRVAIAGVALLMLASAGGAAWKLSRSSPAASKTTAGATAVAQPAASAEPLPVEPVSAQISGPERNSSQPPPKQPVSSTSSSTVADRNAGQPPAEPRRPFVQPTTQQAKAQAQNSPLPLPPGGAPTVSSNADVGLPAVLIGSATVPAPRQRPAAPAPSAPAAKNTAPVGGNAQAAQLVERVLPEYPRVASQLGISGVVEMEATIDEHGSVTNVKVLKGDALLAKAAQNAVMKWKYKPATLNGNPISVSLAVQISFQNRAK